eukprot:11156509-Lingulodinium_polyedra.AAC.1
MPGRPLPRFWPSATRPRRGRRRRRSTSPPSGRKKPGWRRVIVAAGPEAPEGVSAAERAIFA